GLVDLHAEPARLHGEVVVEEAVARVEPDEGARPLLHVARPEDVIEVRVRVEDVFHVQAERADALEDPVGVTTRVHDDGVPGSLAGDDGTVAGEHPDGERLDEQADLSTRALRLGHASRVWSTPRWP